MISARNRYVSRMKALRKKRISDMVYPWFDGEFGYYKHLNQYNKGKIHCSCPLCSAKTRNKGKRRKNCNSYTPAINYKISDLRKIMEMENMVKDLYGDGEFE